MFLLQDLHYYKTALSKVSDPLCSQIVLSMLETGWMKSGNIMIQIGLFCTTVQYLLVYRQDADRWQGARKGFVYISVWNPYASLFFIGLFVCLAYMQVSAKTFGLCIRKASEKLVSNGRRCYSEINGKMVGFRSN